MPGRARFLGAREPAVDEDLRIGNDAIFLLRARGVMALVGDDARPVPPFAHAEQHLLRSQRPLRHAAEPFDAHEAVGFDLADDEAELIHVREKHHARSGRIARRRREEVAQHVGPRREAERAHLPRKTSAHAILVTAEPRNQHQLDQERAQPLAEFAGREASPRSSAQPAPTRAAARSRPDRRAPETPPTRRLKSAASSRSRRDFVDMPRRSLFPACATCLNRGQPHDDVSFEEDADEQQRRDGRRRQRGHRPPVDSLASRSGSPPSPAGSGRRSR